MDSEAFRQVSSQPRWLDRKGHDVIHLEPCTHQQRCYLHNYMLVVCNYKACGLMINWCLMNQFLITHKLKVQRFKGHWLVSSACVFCSVISNSYSQHIYIHKRCALMAILQKFIFSASKVMGYPSWKQKFCMYSVNQAYASL